jgi:hypothetical protein
MRVGILSNTDVRCGNAAYARDLSSALLPYYVNQIVSPVLENMLAFKPNVVLINWHPAKVGNPDVNRIHAAGAKAILIYQNSIDNAWTNGPIFGEDAIVTHEPTALYNATVIPHGIPIVRGLWHEHYEPQNQSVGTAGFPFPWKRFDVVAEVAKRFNLQCMMIAPQHDFYDSRKFIEGIVGHLGPLADVHTEWMEIEGVVRRLSQCMFNVFWYQSKDIHDQFGQSGSVRMGLAARRPLIISDHRKMRDILENYSDEVYVAHSELEVYKHASDILQSIAVGAPVRVPKRILEDQGWPRVAKLYSDLIQRVMASHSPA